MISVRGMKTSQNCYFPTKSFMSLKYMEYLAKTEFKFKELLIFFTAQLLHTHPTGYIEEKMVLNKRLKIRI